MMTTTGRRYWSHPCGGECKFPNNIYDPRCCYNQITAGTSTAPPYRRVDQHTGDVADEAELERLRDENAELHCRVQELETEARYVVELHNDRARLLSENTVLQRRVEKLETELDDATNGVQTLLNKLDTVVAQRDDWRAQASWGER